MKDGAHTHGHGGGGGVGALVAVIVVVVVIAEVGQAVESAARTAVHVLAIVLEVVFISVAVLAAVAVAAVLGWAGVRLYRWRSSRRALAAPAVVRAEVVSSAPLAIEAPKPRPDLHLVPDRQHHREPS